MLRPIEERALVATSRWPLSIIGGRANRSTNGDGCRDQRMQSALPRLQRYPSLDFWRGFACLMVVVFHSSLYAARTQQLHGGARLVFGGIAYLWLGVPLFFVISGYCISATCDSIRRKPRSVKTYLWRRYRRIFPPFWVCSLIVAAVVLAANLAHRVDLFADRSNPIPDPFSLSISQWIGNLTLIESSRGTLFRGHQYFLGPTWSLCYEEQFYIVCGVLLFLSPWKFFRNATLISAVVGIVAIASAAAGLHVQGFFFDGRWLMFAFGMLVYWLLNYVPDELAPKLKWILTTTGVVMIIGILYRPVRQLILQMDERMLEVSVGFVFAVAILHLRRLDSRIMNSRLLAPISLCGTMCYSLYLVHWPVVKVISHGLAMRGITSPKATLLLVIPVCILASIIMARLFYLGIERHFLNPPSLTIPSSQPLARIED
jgi:peptidoglycan/LPS O-acetylase OafA/YrhL